MRSGGFTLLELLLSIGVIGILTALSVPVWSRMIGPNDLIVAASETMASIDRAEVLSQAVTGDSTWGVKIQSGSVTLFQGATYATRSTGFDETYTLPSTITASGVGEIVFAKVTGLPGTTGTITLTGLNGEARSLTINAKGTVDY